MTDEATVTWKQIMVLWLSMTGVLLSAVGGVEAFIWSQHISQPHPGAVTWDSYTDRMKTLDSQLNRLENKVDVLLQRSP